MENNNNLKENIWKHFFMTPKKGYNKYMFQLLDYPEYIIYDKELMNSYKENWKKHFNNDKNIYLEIGSGSGNFISELSQREPENNFICLELRFKRLVLATKKIYRSEGENVLFLRRRAEEIPDFIGQEEISGVYINFPDPWEENEKNRVLQEKFFKILDIILKKKGKIFFKTDHDKYYSDILQLIDTLENYQVIFHTSDLHNSEKNANNIKTEFEQLFLHKHNKNINYIEIQRIC